MNREYTQFRDHVVTAVLWSFVTMIVALLIAVALTGCRRTEPSPPPPPAVKVEETMGDLPNACNDAVDTAVYSWTRLHCKFQLCPGGGHRFKDPRCTDPLTKWANQQKPEYRAAYLRWIRASHMLDDLCPSTPPPDPTCHRDIPTPDGMVCGSCEVPR